MKYLPLVWAALWRKPADALLTLLSITAAFSLFGLMVGLDATTRLIVENSRLDRLWVNPRFFSPGSAGLPIGMSEQISRIDGVSGVGVSRWFDGYHVAPESSVSILAMNEGMRVGWSEGSLSAAQWDALFATPSGLFVSVRAAAKWSLKPGDPFTVISAPGTRADGGTSWVFKVLGVVEDEAELSNSDGFMICNYHFIDNAMPASQQGVGVTFQVAVNDASRAVEVSRRIDDYFANSGTPTISVPKRINTQSEIDRGVSIAAMTWSIAGGGLIMILFLTGSAIARSVRERTPEFAVLETLGFRNAHLMTLVFIEAVIPCLLGAALGTALSASLATTSRHFLPLSLTAQLLGSPPPWLYVLSMAFAFAVILAIAATAVPLSRLRQMSVTDALAGR